NPQPAVEELQQQLDALTPRRADCESALHQLRTQYSDDALHQYRDNLEQSKQVLDAARSSRSEAAEAIASSDTAEAVLAIHSGEQAASDARSLIESMEQT